MPILTTDLEIYKSSNTNSQGGTISATAITDNTLNNLFPDVTANQATTGLTDYYKVFVKNNNGSLTWGSVGFWIASNTTSADDTWLVGIGTASDAVGSNELTTFSAGAKVSLTSDGTDTRNVTVVGLVGGVRTVETVALNGLTEVLTTNTFDSGGVYLVYPASADASRTITIKQGTGGTTRGTIGPNGLSAICYFSTPVSSATALLLGNIAAGASQGLWIKRVVNAGAAIYSNDTGQIECQGTTT